MVWVVRKCGLGREIMVLGQALVAGSMVQGEKLWSWVTPVPARVWSREPNCGLGSSTGGGKCGPGRETAAPGQPQPRRSMVQGAKLRPGSSQTPPKYGLGSKTVPPGHPLPRRSVVWGAKPCPWVKPDPARAWSSHLKYKKESKTNI